jgi:antitoxin (DNA-binding transcriptional repressor) of toxin-antitoxin stability system
MTHRKSKEEAVGVTAFKSRCLALIEDVSQGKTSRILLMKHNRAVAAVVPVEQEQPSLWGALRGTVIVPPGEDLTKGTGESWDADL